MKDVGQEVCRITKVHSCEEWEGKGKETSHALKDGKGAKEGESEGDEEKEGNRPLLAQTHLQTCNSPLQSVGPFQPLLCLFSNIITELIPRSQWEENMSSFVLFFGMIEPSLAWLVSSLGTACYISERSTFFLNLYLEQLPITEAKHCLLTKSSGRKLPARWFSEWTICSPPADILSNFLHGNTIHLIFFYIPSYIFYLFYIFFLIFTTSPPWILRYRCLYQSIQQRNFLWCNGGCSSSFRTQFSKTIFTDRWGSEVWNKTNNYRSPHRLRQSEKQRILIWDSCFPSSHSRRIKRIR